jgi:hypothetical protein
MLTREKLNQCGCDKPNCTDSHDVLFIDPICHDEGVSASYDKATGALTLSCHVCGHPMVAILVAATDKAVKQ